MGDACELQEAQLHFASAELHDAVAGIITNLQEISGKQRRLTEDIHGDSGVIDTSGRSFIDDVRHHMASITELLTVGMETNNQVAGIMRSITTTVDAISTFVADIEDIGQDVILIALNARIKAAGTGQEGASLGVLAEEIGHLANEDTHRTQTITAALKEMHTATVGLAAVVDQSEAHLSATLGGMQAELDTILATLGTMGKELFSLLVQVQHQAQDLVRDIERLAASIDIHQRTRDLAQEVLSELRRIVAQSRAIFPASDVFKEELRQVAERYTMDSERRIHEAISRKHGLEIAASEQTMQPRASDDASEFGDNVDLF
jgi:methyl-accepting chemotaxis protein